MEDIKKLYEKAGLLMKCALKKYASGDYKGAEKDRKQANETYDLAEKYIDMKIGNEENLYGEGKNFGIIYTIIESNAPKWFLSKKYSKSIKDICECIKHDKILLSEFKIYNAFNRINNGINPNEYIDAVLSITPKFSIKSLSESNQKLIDIIRKYHGNELVEINDDKANMFESVEYLITNKKTIDNINEYMKHKSILSSFLNENTYNEQNNSIDEDIQNIDNKVNNNLNEDELNILNGIEKYGNASVFFENTKKDILKSVNSLISESDGDKRERWKQIKESIDSMQYDDTNGIDNLIKLYEISGKLTD